MYTLITFTVILIGLTTYDAHHDGCGTGLCTGV